jgi:hypothetical protein
MDGQRHCQEMKQWWQSFSSTALRAVTLDIRASLHFPSELSDVWGCPVLLFSVPHPERYRKEIPKRFPMHLTLIEM